MALAVYTGISSSTSDKEVILKLTYGGCMRRLKYQQKERNGFLVWAPDLSFETLHSHIEELFQIPSTERFLVTYTDIDNDVIAMSNSDDVRDVIEGRSISCSMNPVRLGVSLIGPQSRSVGGAPCGQLVNVGEFILPASKGTRSHGNIYTNGFREQMRFLSYNMLRNPKLRVEHDSNLVTTTKLLKLYEASQWSSSPTQIPVDLIENLVERVILTFPDLRAFQVL